MIRNLNRFTFAAFGEILSQDAAARSFSQEQDGVSGSVSFTPDEVWVYRAEHTPTSLEIESGTAALAVSREGEALEYFYLDKPVRLNQNVRFAIVPREPCVVRREIPIGGSWARQSLLEAAQIPGYIKSRMEVRAVYTLFYQESIPEKQVRD